MKLLLVSLLAVGLFSYSNMAEAKKVCKELKVSQCKKRKDCSWVKKSKRKNGQSVSAYCRKKSK